MGFPWLYVHQNILFQLIEVITLDSLSGSFYCNFITTDIIEGKV